MAFSQISPSPAACCCCCKTYCRPAYERKSEVAAARSATARDNPRDEGGIRFLLQDAGVRAQQRSHDAAQAQACEGFCADTASGAIHFGIDPAKLAAVRDYKTSPLFNDAERTALDLAVSASSTPNIVTEQTFSELRRHWNEEQIVELVGVIAVAGFLSRWNVTMATPIEPEPN